MNAGGGEVDQGLPVPDALAACINGRFVEDPVAEVLETLAGIEHATLSSRPTRPPDEQIGAHTTAPAHQSQHRTVAGTAR
jgi:hypothetical protein